MKVLKRDGTIQGWSTKKIKRALVMAFAECGEPMPNLTPLINTISTSFNKTVVDIEIIQDAVERELMGSGHARVAKAFILYREHRRLQRDKRLEPDNSALAEYIHAAKYARYVPHLGRRETYGETVERVEQMHLHRFPDHVELIREAFQFVYDRKVLPSMRSMQD